MGVSTGGISVWWLAYFWCCWAAAAAAAAAAAFVAPGAALLKAARTGTPSPPRAGQVPRMAAKISSSNENPIVVDAANNFGDVEVVAAPARKRRKPRRQGGGASAARGGGLAWRVFGVEVPLSLDPGKDESGAPCPALFDALAQKLGLGSSDGTWTSSVQIVRKSFDARGIKAGGEEPRFVYTVDISDPEVTRKLRAKPGRIEPTPLIEFKSSPSSSSSNNSSAARVVVIGSGPAGLFAAISLVEAGLHPVIVERGQPVEKRGRDIGALMARKILDPESNLCFGEGGAGTWSDGKLTTRIGRNSGEVRLVLERLVEHGAPESILTDSKPHLGTDRLVRILMSMRAWLTERGATFRFGTRVDDLDIRGGRVHGVRLADGDLLQADAVVLAVGHSTQLYTCLMEHEVALRAKTFAVGFRIEHPQTLINEIQYGRFASQVDRGKGPVPVADYRLVHNNVRSFCMCPGGQIVPTSLNPEEVCINGMSFSRRSSRWANSAIVTDVHPEETAELGGGGTLSGLAWQKIMERRAAVVGGGNLVIPVQRVTDFLAGEPSPSTGLPSSSYRLGVRSARCDIELYPPNITVALREAIMQFEKRMPGFITPEALLHGVETRTSAPIQIDRDAVTLCSTSTVGLYPSGEGAGHAGGIMSASVDGMRVGLALALEMAGTRAGRGGEAGAGGLQV